MEKSEQPILFQIVSMMDVDKIYTTTKKISAC
jgi:hypothetical protein